MKGPVKAMPLKWKTLPNGKKSTTYTKRKTGERIILQVSPSKFIGTDAAWIKKEQVKYFLEGKHDRKTVNVERKLIQKSPLWIEKHPNDKSYIHSEVSIQNASKDQHGGATNTVTKTIIQTRKHDSPHTPERSQVITTIKDENGVRELPLKDVDHDARRKKK